MPWILATLLKNLWLWLQPQVVLGRLLLVLNISRLKHLFFFVKYLKLS